MNGEEQTRQLEERMRKPPRHEDSLSNRQQSRTNSPELVLNITAHDDEEGDGPSSEGHFAATNLNIAGQRTMKGDPQTLSRTQQRRASSPSSSGSPVHQNTAKEKQRTVEPNELRSVDGQDENRLVHRRWSSSSHNLSRIRYTDPSFESRRTAMMDLSTKVRQTNSSGYRERKKDEEQMEKEVDRTVDKIYKGEFSLQSWVPRLKESAKQEKPINTQRASPKDSNKSRIPRLRKRTRSSNVSSHTETVGKDHEETAQSEPAIESPRKIVEENVLSSPVAERTSYKSSNRAKIPGHGASEEQRESNKHSDAQDKRQRLKKGRDYLKIQRKRRKEEKERKEAEARRRVEQRQLALENLERERRRRAGRLRGRSGKSMLQRGKERPGLHGEQMRETVEKNTGLQETNRLAEEDQCPLGDLSPVTLTQGVSLDVAVDSERREAVSITFTNSSQTVSHEETLHTERGDSVKNSFDSHLQTVSHGPPTDVKRQGIASNVAGDHLQYSMSAEELGDWKERQDSAQSPPQFQSHFSQSIHRSQTEYEAYELKAYRSEQNNDGSDRSSIASTEDSVPAEIGLLSKERQRDDEVKDLTSFSGLDADSRDIGYYGEEQQQSEERQQGSDIDGRRDDGYEREHRSDTPRFGIPAESADGSNGVVDPSPKAQMTNFFEELAKKSNKISQVPSSDENTYTRTSAAFADSMYSNEGATIEDYAHSGKIGVSTIETEYPGELQRSLARDATKGGSRRSMNDRKTKRKVRSNNRKTPERRKTKRTGYAKKPSSRTEVDHNAYAVSGKPSNYSVIRLLQDQDNAKKSYTEGETSSEQRNAKMTRHSSSCENSEQGRVTRKKSTKTKRGSDNGFSSQTLDAEENKEKHKVPKTYTQWIGFPSMHNALIKEAIKHFGGSDDADDEKAAAHASTEDSIKPKHENLSVSRPKISESAQHNSIGEARRRAVDRVNENYPERTNELPPAAALHSQLLEGLNDIESLVNYDKQLQALVHSKESALLKEEAAAVDDYWKNHYQQAVWNAQVMSAENAAEQEVEERTKQFTEHLSEEYSKKVSELTRHMDSVQREIHEAQQRDFAVQTEAPAEGSPSQIEKRYVSSTNESIAASTENKSANFHLPENQVRNAEEHYALAISEAFKQYRQDPSKLTSIQRRLLSEVHQISPYSSHPASQQVCNHSENVADTSSYGSDYEDYSADFSSFSSASQHKILPALNTYPNRSSHSNGNNSVTEYVSGDIAEEVPDEITPEKAGINDTVPSVSEKVGDSPSTGVREESNSVAEEIESWSDRYPHVLSMRNSDISNAQTSSSRVGSQNTTADAKRISGAAGTSTNNDETPSGTTVHDSQIASAESNVDQSYSYSFDSSLYDEDYRQSKRESHAQHIGQSISADEPPEELPEEDFRNINDKKSVHSVSTSSNKDYSAYSDDFEQNGYSEDFTDSRSSKEKNEDVSTSSNKEYSVSSNDIESSATHGRFRESRKSENKAKNLDDELSNSFESMISSLGDSAANGHEREHKQALFKKFWEELKKRKQHDEYILNLRSEALDETFKISLRDLDKRIQKERGDDEQPNDLRRRRHRLILWYHTSKADIQREIAQIKSRQYQDLTRFYRQLEPQTLMESEGFGGESFVWPQDVIAGYIGASLNNNDIGESRKIQEQMSNTFSISETAAPVVENQQTKADATIERDRHSEDEDQYSSSFETSSTHVEGKGEKEKLTSNVNHQSYDERGFSSKGSEDGAGEVPEEDIEEVSTSDDTSNDSRERQDFETHAESQTKTDVMASDGGKMDTSSTSSVVAENNLETHSGSQPIADSSVSNKCHQIDFSSTSSVVADVTTHSFVSTDTNAITAEDITLSVDNHADSNEQWTCDQPQGLPNEGVSSQKSVVLTTGEDDQIITGQDSNVKEIESSVIEQTVSQAVKDYLSKPRTSASVEPLPELEELSVSPRSRKGRDIFGRHVSSSPESGGSLSDSMEDSEEDLYDFSNVEPGINLTATGEELRVDMPLKGIVETDSQSKQPRAPPLEIEEANDPAKAATASANRAKRMDDQQKAWKEEARMFLDKLITILKSSPDLAEFYTERVWELTEESKVGSFTTVPSQSQGESEFRTMALCGVPHEDFPGPLSLRAYILVERSRQEESTEETQIKNRSLFDEINAFLLKRIAQGAFKHWERKSLSPHEIVNLERDNLLSHLEHFCRGVGVPEDALTGAAAYQKAEMQARLDARQWDPLWNDDGGESKGERVNVCGLLGDSILKDIIHDLCDDVTRVLPQHK